MNPKLNYIEEIPWLKGAYHAKKRKTVELGREAINHLLKEGKALSYRSIAQKSKEIDMNNKGFHPNTVKSNPELYNLYLEHCSQKTKAHRTKKSTKVKLDDSDMRNVKIGRDIETAKRRYLRLSKPELVSLLINAEQYIAEQNQKWLREQFASFK